MATSTVPSPARTAGRGAGRLPLRSPADPGRRQLLHQRVRRVGTAAVLVLLVAGVAAPAAVTAAAPALAVAGVLLGLPHGAVDHLVPGWAAMRPLPRRRLAALLAGYVLVVAAGAIALAAAPLPTLVAFVAVSAWHFGRGEVVARAEAEQRPVPAAGQELLPALAHGVVTTVLPVAAWPAVTLPLLAVLAPAAGRAPGWVPAALAVLVAVVVPAALALLLRRHRTAEAAELALLTAVFWLVHPFAAFGVYFGLWHALRHTARLVDLAAGDGPLGVGARRVAVQALLPTAGALTFLAGILATARYAPAPLATGLLAAELATLVGLTFPHAVVVAALDRRRARATA